MALEQEFKYFLDHQQEFSQEHLGEFVVIKEDRVLGFYPTQLAAYTETTKTEQAGTFLIQRCMPGTDVYTQTFHTRVIART